MQKLVMVVLGALPLVACVGSVEDADGNGDDGMEAVGTVEQPLRTPDYLVDFDQIVDRVFFPTASTLVASGSVVDTLYSSYGVNFSCVTVSSVGGAGRSRSHRSWCTIW